MLGTIQFLFVDMKNYRLYFLSPAVNSKVSGITSKARMRPDPTRSDGSLFKDIPTNTTCVKYPRVHKLWTNTPNVLAIASKAIS